MPLPTQHIAVTLPLLAAVPKRWRVPLFAGAVLIDVDHFVDVAWMHWGNDEERAFVPLHGLDVIAAVVALAWSRRDERIAAFALGMALHHAMDYAAERDWVKIALLWRAKRRFFAPHIRREWMRRSPVTWF